MTFILAACNYNAKEMIQTSVSVNCIQMECAHSANFFWTNGPVQLADVLIIL